MPRRPAAKLQREQRLAEISQEYLKGATQMMIAEKIGVNQSTVSRAIKTLHQRWREQQLTDTNLAIQIELERIAQLEQEYWSAWERSRDQRTIRSSKRQQEPSRGRGQLPIEKTESGLKTEDRDGDPRFLEGVRWCVAKRIELLGLLPSQRPPGTFSTDCQPQGGDEQSPAIAGRIAELAAIFDAGRSRASRAAIEGTVVQRDDTEAD